MTLEPGCLCTYTLTSGDRSYVLLARYIGLRPCSGDKKLQVMIVQGDGRGHIMTVIRTGVMREKVCDLETYFRRREIDRLRQKGKENVYNR